MVRHPDHLGPFAGGELVALLQQLIGLERTQGIQILLEALFQTLCHQGHIAVGTVTVPAVPLEVIRQRPDVARAQQELVAAAEGVGVARAALDEAWEYITQRQAFGQPLSAFQGVTHPLAQYDTEVEGARLVCLQGLWLKDQGLPHSAEAGMAKWWGPKLAYDVIHQCLLCFGHGGYDRGPMEQRMRDVLGFQIGDGTAQIMKTIIARTRAGRKNVPA